MDWLFGPDPIVRIQRAFGDGGAGIATATSLLGATWGTLLVAAVALWSWDRRVFASLLGLTAVSQALRLALALAFGTARPEAGVIIKYAHAGSTPGFPSGHVTLAVALWAWLALRRQVSWGWVALVAVTVSLARLYLGVHDLADPLGGILLGLTVAWGWHHVWPLLEPQLAAVSARSIAVLAGALFVAAALAVLFVLQPNRFAWRGAAFAGGVPLAATLEWYLVRSRPSRDCRRRKLAVGLAGVLALLLLDAFLPGPAPQRSAALIVVAAFWALLLSPALFVALGWSSRATPSPAEGHA